MRKKTPYTISVEAVVTRVFDIGVEVEADAPSPDERAKDLAILEVENTLLPSGWDAQSFLCEITKRGR